MKKKLLILIFVISFVSVNAQAYIRSENDLTISEQGSVPTGTVYIQKNFNTKTKWGFSNFVLVTKDWAEMTPSITYTTGKFSFNLGLGLETAKPYWRFTGGAVFIDSLNTVKLFFEQGGGTQNYWWHGSYERNVNKFTVGVMSRRFYGTGVRVGYNLSKTFLIQLAPLYDTEANFFKTSFFLIYTL